MIAVDGVGNAAYVGGEGCRRRGRWMKVNDIRMIRNF